MLKSLEKLKNLGKFHFSLKNPEFCFAGAKHPVGNTTAKLKKQQNLLKNYNFQQFF
jgi:hypothetical protein